MIGYLGLSLLLFIIIDNNNQAATEAERFRIPDDDNGRDKHDFALEEKTKHRRPRFHFHGRRVHARAPFDNLLQVARGWQSRCCAARELCAFALCSTDRDDRTRLSVDRSYVGLDGMCHSCVRVVAA